MIESDGENGIFFGFQSDGEIVREKKEMHEWWRLERDWRNVLVSFDLGGYGTDENKASKCVFEFWRLKRDKRLEAWNFKVHIHMHMLEAPAGDGVTIYVNQN